MMPVIKNVNVKACEKHLLLGIKSYIKVKNKIKIIIEFGRKDSDINSSAGSVVSVSSSETITV